MEQIPTKTEALDRKNWRKEVTRAVVYCIFDDEGTLKRAEINESLLVGLAMEGETEKAIQDAIDEAKVISLDGVVNPPPPK